MSYGRPSNGFFTSVTTTNDWQAVDFGFTSGRQILICDSVNAAHFSFDPDGDLVLPSAKAIHGDIRQNEELSFDCRYAEKMWLKSKVGGAAATVRVYVW